MKMKTCVLALLLTTLSATQLWAQNGKSGSGTIIEKGSFGPWTIPVYCDGTITDYVTCPDLNVVMTMHSVKGTVVWGINRVESREWISQNTGEVYKGVASFDHWSDAKGSIMTVSHLIGNKGHNISVKIIRDATTFDIIEVTSNCR
jgi:hypothetical protein